ncbi:MAG: FIST C-terminal domain-containing protein, partial [Candidatus Heimdallarchaeota archaeon]
PLAINDDNTENIQILFPMARGRGASDLVMSQTIPEGKKVYLMEADVERSKSASLECFKAAFASSTIKDPRLGMMFSCVGRSTFYFGRAHEEIDEIRKRFKYTDIGGAYLYGTICGENNYISEGTTSTLLIGNDLQDRTVKEE